MTKSGYADRDTVGTIAQLAARSKERVQVGDMVRTIMPQLVDDLNEAIASNPFEDRPYYIVNHEKKDLMLKNTMLRRVLRQEYRPYPEENTHVFWTDPKSQETLFCWSLPHRTEFPNILENASKYSKELLKDIIAYQKERLDHFGFYKAGETEDKTPIYYPILGFKDRKLRGNR
jgi:hypothetical protein